jgi:hypothetical protein
LRLFFFNESFFFFFFFFFKVKSLADNERSAVLSKADFVRRFAPTTATHQTPMPSSTLTPMSVASALRDNATDDSSSSVVPTKLHFDDDSEAQLRNSVQQLRAQVATLSESLGVVSEQLSLEKMHHGRSEATVREMQQENAQAEQRAATLVKEAKALSHALDSARQRVEELEEALRNAELLRADEGQRAAAAAKKADLRHQAVLAEVMMVRQSFATAEIDCLNSRKLLDGATAANERLTADNDALRSELAALNERCVELEASVHLLKDENSRINEEFALTRRSSDQLSRRESTNPASAMSTPAATPARAGLFQSPATPAGSVIGTLRPALLDELVQAMPTPTVAPETPSAANDELVAALKSLQSLYSRSVAHGEQLSVRIGEASAQRDDEVAEVRAQLAQAASRPAGDATSLYNLNRTLLGMRARHCLWRLRSTLACASTPMPRALCPASEIHGHRETSTPEFYLSSSIISETLSNNE